MSKRRVRRLLARWFLRMTGWTTSGARPAPRRYVLIAAPHTSNWDFPYLLAFAAVYDIPIAWMGKHTLFRFPLGPIMRALGGVPVRRHAREQLVEAMARTLGEHDELALVVPVEGTRARTEHWKSGFYHIARRAGVPIVMSFLDYAQRRGGFGPAFEPSGDVVRDMDHVRAFYADKQGLFPERFGPIRLREEEWTPASPGDETAGARAGLASVEVEPDDAPIVSAVSLVAAAGEVHEDR
ncbi:MAG: lysophospholipid acyltransferase family protein [Myxococcota bacterium]